MFFYKRLINGGDPKCPRGQVERKPSMWHQSAPHGVGWKVESTWGPSEKNLGVTGKKKAVEWLTSMIFSRTYQFLNICGGWVSGHSHGHQCWKSKVQVLQGSIRRLDPLNGFQVSINKSVGFSGAPNNGTPYLYYSHTTPTRIHKDMGMVWE